MNRRDFLNYALTAGAALLVPEPLIRIVEPILKGLVYTPEGLSKSARGLDWSFPWI